MRFEEFISKIFPAHFFANIHVTFAKGRGAQEVRGRRLQRYHGNPGYPGPELIVAACVGDERNVAILQKVILDMLSSVNCRRHEFAMQASTYIPDSCLNSIVQIVWLPRFYAFFNPQISQLLNILDFKILQPLSMFMNTWMLLNTWTDFSTPAFSDLFFSL